MSSVIRLVRSTRGIFFGGAMLAIAGVFAVAGCGKAPSDAKGNGDQSNLTAAHQAVAKYRAEHNGEYPSHGDAPKGLMFSPKGIYPDYVSDPNILVNPNDENAVAKVKGLAVNEQNLNAYWYNNSYVYMGYAMTTEKTGLAFVNAYRDAVKAGTPLSGPISVPEGEGSGGGDKIYPLREGVNRLFVQDINNPAATEVSESDIPVMFSMPINGIGNVLYMDGHVEEVRYPGKFPMTEKFIDAVKSLNSMLQPNPSGTVPQ